MKIKTLDGKWFETTPDLAADMLAILEDFFVNGFTDEELAIRYNRRGDGASIRRARQVIARAKREV